MRNWHGVLPAAALLSLAACQDSAAPSPFSSAALAGALAAAPAGYGELTSSFVGGAADVASADSVGGFCGGRERGMRGDAMMGGGLHDAFLGGMGFGRGFAHHGPFGGGLRCEGTFADGRVSCAPVTRNGLTITRSAAYSDASGAVQEAFDSVTTNTVNLRVAVTGTLTFTARDGATGGGMHGGDGRGDRHHGGRGGALGRLLGDTARILTATTQVNNASDRTVSGLAQGSTQRTVSGISSGSETTTGTTSRGEFTATRTIADTTTGLVVPVQATGAYPTAGTVVRTMTATLAYVGETRSVRRREVVTYDGSATARITITMNGTTRNCTRALPRGALACE